MKFSWEEYALDFLNKSEYELLLANNRENLLRDFRNTRQINAEISEFILESMRISKERKWKNVENMNNSLLFVLRRDTEIKIKAEQLIETDDSDRIVRAAIECCVLIFETLQKIETVAGGSFNKSAREIGVQEDAIKALNAEKKVVHQFSQRHSKSLKYVRDSAGSHFDPDYEIYQIICDNIERQKFVSMLVDFAKKFNKIALAMQAVLMNGICSIEQNPSLGS